MRDTRFQLILDDIDAAVRNRRAANAAIDDARTKLADIAEESPPPLIQALINRATTDLNNSTYGNDFGRLANAHTIIKRASEVA